ncbi:GntR family transcriptional regulator [Deinococcus alpinitundrae]|uniref:GntR family transcriptional regulator n=1 Tax=Deinococcus alpinitundrae TaxID=468913 RepID=UPI001379C196|nr:GntR family transcriptional regulator [Deinococcus alpinitundrae]
MTVFSSRLEAASPDAAGLASSPRYVQVARTLESAIERGEYQPGNALPAERELAVRLGVSRVTVRQAIAQLAVRGLVVRRHGSGTFVAPSGPPVRIQHPLSRLTSFTEDMHSRGLSAGGRVLSFTAAHPSVHDAMKLNLSPGQLVYRVRRLRTAGGEALAVEESLLNAGRLGPLSAADVQDVSLYALLQARGAGPVRALRQLRAVNADDELAGLLGVSVGAALLATERLAWDAAGQPVELARAHYRGDRYDFVMELRD